MGLPPFRYESFSFRRETAGFPRVFYIFWQRKQLLPRPTGPINWDLAGKARSKCVTNAGHKVQLPLGPSTSRLSGKLGFGGPKPSPGRGWLAQRDGCGAVQLTWFPPHPPQCAHWGTFPQGKASPRQIRICPTGFWVGARNAGVHNALKPQKHPLPDLGGDGGFWNTELRTVPSSSCRRRCPCPQ